MGRDRAWLCSGYERSGGSSRRIITVGILAVAKPALQTEFDDVSPSTNGDSENRRHFVSKAVPP